MKKIVIQKEEGVAEVIDRVLEEQDDELALVIPKGSNLGRSVRSFHLLKREADGAGKSLMIESVDDTILAFAKDSGFEANHPLWRGVQGTGGMSDIIPSDDVPAREAPNTKKRRSAKKMEPVKLAVRSEESDDEDEETAKFEEETVEEEREFKEKEGQFFGMGRFFNKKSGGENDAPADDEDDEDKDSEDSPGSRKLIWIVVGVVVLLVIVLGVMTWVFGRATITINFQQTPWTYQDNFAADKSVPTINPTTNVIPAQVFTTQKNTTQLFPASGSANVSLKAQGTITVYNAYDSATQDLVATTRFVTPDGHIFRLVNSITVPGAQVTNGQIVPSSINAAIVADQAGTGYNVGPVAKLTIPGFQGSPKYDGFYGTIASGTSGGFVGTRPVPTTADITNAKASVTTALKANLASDLTTSYPNNFKILDGATNVAVNQLTVNTTTDANGQFSVFGQATLSAIGFDESAFKLFLLSLAQAQDPSSTFNSLTLNYSNIQPNFTTGRVSFSLSGQGTLEPAFSPSNFAAQVAGDSLGDARTAIAGLPGLSSGKIAVWPMWLWDLPSNPAKIQVNAS